MLCSAEVPDFKTLNSHVAFVFSREDSASSGWSEMRCVEDRRFARITSKSNESIAGISGLLDGHQFFVDSTPNVGSAARPRSVCGMLNSAPRRSLSARVRIIPGRRHVEGSVCLAKRYGDAS